MRFESERELEDLLFENWWKVRDERLFDPFIYFPRDTVHRSISRQVQIPGAAFSGGTGRADLVECVVCKNPVNNRLVNDLRVSVFELKNVQADVLDIEQAWRYALGLSHSLRKFGESIKINLPCLSWEGPLGWAEFGAVVIAPSFTSRAESALRMLASRVGAGVCIQGTTFSYDPFGGLTFEPAGSTSSLSSISQAGRQPITSVVGEDALSLWASENGEPAQDQEGEQPVTAPGGEA